MNQNKVELTESDKKNILEKEAVISIKMITDIIKVVDTACSRGAFRGAEMSFVGKIYDDLTNGVNKATEAVVKEKTEKLNPIKEE